MYLFIYSVVYFRMVLFTTGRWQSKTAAIIDEQCFRLTVALFLWLIDQRLSSVTIVFDFHLPG